MRYQFDLDVTTLLFNLRKPTSNDEDTIVSTISGISICGPPPELQDGTTRCVNPPNLSLIVVAGGVIVCRRTCCPTFGCASHR